MSLVDLLALALATNYAVEAWRHGSIFITQRARWQARSGWFADLLNCAFCLSSHVAFWLILVGYGLPLFLPDPYAAFPKFLVWALGAARLANLVNDVTYGFCRTPGRLSEIVLPEWKEHEMTSLVEKIAWWLKVKTCRNPREMPRGHPCGNCESCKIADELLIKFQKADSEEVDGSD